MDTVEKSMQIKTATLPFQKTLGYYINNLTPREKHFPCRHPRLFFFNRPIEVPEHSYHGSIVVLSLGVRDLFKTLNSRPVIRINKILVNLFKKGYLTILPQTLVIGRLGSA